MPFEKGKSGNPNGRPTKPDVLKEAFRQMSMQAAEILKGIISDENAKTADRIRAAEIVLDRHLGKAVQAVDANITDRRPIIFDALFAQVVRPQIEDGNTINHVDADTDESP